MEHISKPLYYVFAFFSALVILPLSVSVELSSSLFTTPLTGNVSHLPFQMPLIKRAVSPVDVSRVKIPPEVTNGELQFVANSTLANLIRQLSSISKHAEHIFGEIYLEAMKLDHKSNTLEKRIANLTEKVSKLDSTNEQGTFCRPKRLLDVS